MSIKQLNQVKSRFKKVANSSKKVLINAHEKRERSISRSKEKAQHTIHWLTLMIYSTILLKNC